MFAADGSIDLAKGLEKLIHFFLGDTYACIRNCKMKLILLLSNGLGGDGYGYLALVCKLDGIGKQIN